MKERRRHRFQRASRLARRLAPHLIVFAMLVAFAPHCLFGCSMAMDAAAPTATVGAVMACCDTVCPMNHADECLSTDEESSALAAVLRKSERTVPDVAPVSLAESSFPATHAQAWTSASAPAPSPPPVPLHLLHAQFLI